MEYTKRNQLATDLIKLYAEIELHRKNRNTYPCVFSNGYEVEKAQETILKFLNAFDGDDLLAEVMNFAYVNYPNPTEKTDFYSECKVLKYLMKKPLKERKNASIELTYFVENVYSLDWVYDCDSIRELSIFNISWSDLVTLDFQKMSHDAIWYLSKLIKYVDNAWSDVVCKYAIMKFGILNIHKFFDELYLENWILDIPKEKWNNVYRKYEYRVIDNSFGVISASYPGLDNPDDYVIMIRIIIHFYDKKSNCELFDEITEEETWHYLGRRLPCNHAEGILINKSNLKMCDETVTFVKEDEFK